MTSRRPAPETEEIRTTAVERLSARSPMYLQLDCEESDEEDLREALLKTSWAMYDSDELARRFADEAGMDVYPEHFEIAEQLKSIASDIHDAQVREWVASGAAERTVSDTLRVTVVESGEQVEGLAFLEPRYDPLGKFAFVPADEIDDWRDPEGGFKRYRIVEWERVATSHAPTQADLDMVEGQRRREALYAARSARQRIDDDARRAVEKLTKGAEVDLPQAEAIWAELGLGEDVDRALRIWNAIHVKMIAREVALRRGA